MSAKDPVIVVNDLCKTYKVSDKSPGFKNTLKHLVQRRMREVQAVKSANFSLPSKSITGFLGENGAGKTTTLKMLSGLIAPTSGSATVLSHTPFSRKRDLLKQITLVMGGKQQLIWDLPALDSYKIHGAVYDISESDLQKRIAELAGLLEINEILTTPVRKLSLGQRMKAELIASLLHHPKVLFLDEPTLGLDINAQNTIRSFLKAYKEEQGATILLTSHYMADITALCERVIVMKKGSIVFDDSLSALQKGAADHREVHLEFETIPKREELETYAKVLRFEKEIAVLEVPSPEGVQLVRALVQAFSLSDISLKDPSVEDIVGRLFRDESAP